MRVFYFTDNDEPNVGDRLTPYLIRRLAGVDPKLATVGKPDDPLIVAAGSVLGTKDIDFTNGIVWGSGFLSARQRMNNAPKDIRALRGPLSGAVVEAQGIDHPGVFGDPAIILPFIFAPKKVERDDRIGICPHYIDKGHAWIKRAKKDGRFRILNVSERVEDFVRSVVSCAAVVSSSLHAIIIADAYGIPAVWAEFSDKVAGGGFKFRDYFAGVGRPDVSPFQIRDDGVPADAVIASVGDAFRIPGDIQSTLLASCPFMGKGD
jgi:pyruvyltransferase